MQFVAKCPVSVEMAEVRRKENENAKGNVNQPLYADKEKVIWNEQITD
ncbi:MAG: hypothetical protein AAF892_05230 [Cyanobacteria bacterium P01_D01_bin.71]